MFTPLFLLFILIISCQASSGQHKKEYECQKKEPSCEIKPSCEKEKTCRKTPTTYCVRNTLQQPTSTCICDLSRTVLIKAFDGTFTCATNPFVCNSTNTDICCPDGTFIDINPYVPPYTNLCRLKYPTGPLNTSYTCNITADTNIQCFLVNQWIQMTFGDGCYANFTAANPNITQSDFGLFPLYGGECCAQYYRREGGECVCTERIPSIDPPFECDNPNTCNPSSCNTFYPGSVYRGQVVKNCACALNQNFTYDCTQYQCQDRCEPGATLVLNDNLLQTFSCTCPPLSTRCPPGSNGLDLSCQEKELIKTRCYTDGINYINYVGIPCNCNWTKLADVPCPQSCPSSGSDSSPSDSQLCQQKENTPYPRCKIAKNECGKPCDVCATSVAAPGTYCRDVKLDDVCIAHFYHKCGTCEYPGTEQVCPA